MSRFLLLFLFLLWMTGTSDPGLRPPDAAWPSDWAPSLHPAAAAGGFLGFYAFLVLMMGTWSRLLARRVASPDFGRKLNRFNHAAFAGRLLVVVWFGLGVFVLGWSETVMDRLGLARLGPVRMPGLLVGTMPPLLAWAALWWAQYPAERAMREQHLLGQLHEGLPVHAPPPFVSYFVTNLRLQLLFTVIPIFLIASAHDVVMLAFDDQLPPETVVDRHSAGRAEVLVANPEFEKTDSILWLASAAFVFVVAPEVLRRVLRTTPLADSPLRRRLETLCRTSGMRYRDILLWHTDHNMGNAAVMGIVPRMRYILLSDVLMETMSDDQIEAVFAHEVGHVVHKHMTWFVIFFAVILLGLAGPGARLGTLLEDYRLISSDVSKVAGLVGGTALFIVAFGYLSRRFERQADVYAARTIQAFRRPTTNGTGGFGAFLGDGAELLMRGARQLTGGPVPELAGPSHPAIAPPTTGAGESTSYVGHHGATLFGSALHRVARVNNIPIAKNEWLHGSIAGRMQYLRDLSSDPANTGRFDRVMTRLYCSLLFALVASAAWICFTVVR